MLGNWNRIRMVGEGCAWRSYDRTPWLDCFGGGAEGERVGTPLKPRVTYAARRSRSNARRASTLEAVETQ